MSKYKIIKGRFHVKGYSPDGDSIRFEADNPKHWNSFKWKTKNLKKRKKKQLRIEAIDALETHYLGLGQPKAFAIAALERMLELMNITDVEYNLLVTKITSANDNQPGFIASNKVDIFSRPISYVFPKNAKLNDGDELTIDELPLKKSINYILLKEGIVYPCFYTTTEPLVVEKFFKTVRSSRRYRKGLWAIDKSLGFKLWNVNTIQQDVIIFPKLFRRFVSFFNHRSNIDNFLQFLDDNSDPIELHDGTITSLRELIVVDERQYSLLVEPEYLKFIPR